MKKISLLFFQLFLIVFSVGTFTFLLWEPHLEGRNIHATTFEIYFKDPFLAYVYIASIAFFVAIYQAFKALGYVRQNKIFSQATVKALRTIKYSAILLSMFIIIAAIYIRVFHAKEDDPAGFIALCIMAAFISVVIAAAAGTFERRVQNAINIKSKNDLTV